MRLLRHCQAGGGDLQVSKLVKSVGPRLQRLFGAPEHCMGTMVPKIPWHVYLAMAASPETAVSSPAWSLEHICPSLLGKNQALNGLAAPCLCFLPLGRKAGSISIPPQPISLSH